MAEGTSVEDLAALNRLQSTKDTVPWWHVLHQYSRWETIREGLLMAVQPGHAWQRRACVRCGREQRRLT